MLPEGLSPQAASAEVTAYTGVDLTADEIRSLHKILTVDRKDTAILSHLKAAHHRLGELAHLPEGENWWDQVRIATRAAEHNAYIEEKAGTHKAPVAHDRKAVIFWLEHRILPALSQQDSATATGNLTQAASAPDQPNASGTLTPSASGQGPLADAKKRRALERYAVAAATRYYQRQWHVEPVSHIHGVLDLRIVHRVTGEERRVEVKGSSQPASHVEVTDAEVRRSREEHCDLFVLDKIDYQDTGPGPDDYTCRYGRGRVSAWYAEDENLTPRTYRYQLNAAFGKPSRKAASPAPDTD